MVLEAEAQRQDGTYVHLRILWLNVYFLNDPRSGSTKFLCAFADASQSRNLLNIILSSGVD